MPISDLTGTKWLFDENFYPNESVNATYDINFVSNGQNFGEFNIVRTAFETPNENFVIEIYLTYGDEQVFSYHSENVTSSGGWTSQAYRTIEITGGTDATNASLIAWLEENATQVEVTDLSGTEWIFNNSYPYGSVQGIVGNINFNSGNNQYTKLTIDQNLADESTYIFYATSTEDTIVYDSAGYEIPNNWLGDAYRTISITSGTDSANPDLILWLTNNATYQTPVQTAGGMYFGNLAISKIFVGNSEVSKIYWGSTLLYEREVAPSVDPVLANNSWETIKAVCEAGNAGNYWSLGDTKNIKVTIGGTDYDIPHAIVDLTVGRYAYVSDNTKRTNAVFQAVPTIGDYQFNQDTNPSPNGDEAYNGWDYSTLRTSMNSGAIYGMYDSDFTALLEQVKTMAAYSGKTDTLVYSADKLFIPAAREVKANYEYVQSCELGITQYGYYALNSDANANRVKYPYNSQSATYWCLRSPRANNAYSDYRVDDYGTMSYSSAFLNNGLAPCFAF